MASKIIKNNTIVDNDWVIITDPAISTIAEGNVAISMSAWNRMKKSISSRKNIPGLVINSDENPADFSGDITTLPLIAITFSVFSDGRSFSIGNLLRERFGFKGELRAKGHFIRDQLYYLKRCGFISFEFDGSIDLDAAIKSLHDFSNDYQRSASQSLPLFRRRQQ